MLIKPLSLPGLIEIDSVGDEVARPWSCGGLGYSHRVKRLNENTGLFHVDGHFFPLFVCVCV